MEEFIESRPRVCFEVEKVIAISSDGNYQVQWAPVWVSKLHLVGCEYLIQEFLQNQHVKNEPGVVEAEIPIPGNDWNDGLVLDEPNSTQHLSNDTNDITNMLQDNKCIDPPEVKLELDAVQIQEYVSNTQELSSVNTCAASAVTKLEATHLLLENAFDVRFDIGESRNNINKPLVTVECPSSQNTSVRIETGDSRNNINKPPLTVECPQCIDHEEGDICDRTVVAEPFVNEKSIATNEGEGRSAASRFFRSPTRDNNAFPSWKTIYSINNNVEIDKQYDKKIQVSLEETNQTSGMLIEKVVSQQQEKKVHHHQQQQEMEREQQQPQKEQHLLHQWKEQWQEQSERSPHHETNKTFACALCNKSFVSFARLETHQRTHTFSCTLCGKHFSQKCNLNQHMRIHSDSKPFKCTVCEKTFGFNHHLAYHMRTHTGEKPYKCNLCGISFSRKDRLRLHVRRHSEPKSYSCSVCAKTFTQSTQLKRHFKKTNHI